MLWIFMACLLLAESKSSTSHVKCCIDNIFPAPVARKLTKPILFELSQDHLPHETVLMFHHARNELRVPIYERDVVMFAVCTRSRAHAIAVAAVFHSMDNLFDVGNIFI